MHLIWATDIFGITNDLLKIQTQLSQIYSKITLISPYEQQHGFDSDYDAYQMFCQQGGIESYLDKIKTCLIESTSSNNNEETMLLGFSAGAAAMWQAQSDVFSQAPVQQKRFRYLGFYPGQIRYYLDAEACIPCNLVFPRHEPHFDLTTVIRQLQSKQNLSIVQNQYEHGYANEQSDNYNAKAKADLLSLFNAKHVLFDFNSLTDKLVRFEAHQRITN